ncbi:MAG: hypothetical protein KDA45_13825, partial [Planctomycetales bacterium]|nr:hypothetical protein [Planctomycetales bacterium]
MASIIGASRSQSAAVPRQHAPNPPSTNPGASAGRRVQALGELVSRASFEESQRRRLCYDIGQAVIARSRVMQSPNFSTTSASDLQHMAELYDHHFFAGHCLAIARSHGMQFRWSKRMTSTGGKTVR